MTSNMNMLDTARLTNIQYKLMPVVCLITYNCGHYGQKRTERTDGRLESMPAESLFPIDEVESRNEPCGLSRCADMNRDKLYTALFPMINHAFDVLTKLENDHQDSGHRFYLLRPATLSLNVQSPYADLLAMMKEAFEAERFPEQDPPRSPIQKRIDDIEQGLIDSRHSLYRDPFIALSELNNCRRSLCELCREIVTIDRALAWLEDFQWEKEENHEIDGETFEIEFQHIGRATTWAHSLPEAQRAMAKETMRSGCVVRTMFQPDRFLHPGEPRPSYPIEEHESEHGFHSDLGWAWDGPLMLLSMLPRDCQAFRRSHPLWTHVADPTLLNPTLLDPDLTAIPSGSSSRTALLENEIDVGGSNNGSQDRQGHFASLTHNDSETPGHEASGNAVAHAQDGTALPDANWTDDEAHSVPRTRHQDELLLSDIREMLNAEASIAASPRLQSEFFFPGLQGASDSPAAALRSPDVAHMNQGRQTRPASLDVDAAQPGNAWYPELPPAEDRNPEEANDNNVAGIIESIDMHRVLAETSGYLGLQDFEFNISNEEVGVDSGDPGQHQANHSDDFGF